MARPYPSITEQLEDVDVDITDDTAAKAARAVCSHMADEDPEAVREVLDALGILEPLRQKRDRNV